MNFMILWSETLPLLVSISRSVDFGFMLTIFLDFFKTALSLITTVLANLPRVILSVIPHLIILAAFGAFVWWNGSVVLGKFG